MVVLGRWSSALTRAPGTFVLQRSGVMKQLEDELSELGGEMKVVCARLFQYLPKTMVSAVCVPHGAAAVHAVCVLVCLSTA